MSESVKQEFDLVSAPLEAGVTLIEASAGTGKTYNIAGLFTRLILDRGLEAGEILAVTYTEAATKELRDRVQRRLAEALQVLETETVKDPNDQLMNQIRDRAASGDLDRETSKLRLQLALAEFDNAPIFTIHGFCQRMLADRAFECGRPFEQEITTDEMGMLNEIARDFWRVQVVPRKMTASILVGEDLSLRRGGPGSKRLGPEGLATLGGPLLNYPGLEVRGPITDQSMEELEQALETAIAALGEMGASQSDAEVYLKDKASGLKCGPYKPETVDGYFESIDAILQMKFTYGQWGDLKWFLPDAIREAGTGKFQEPDGAAVVFFSACEAVSLAGKAIANGCRSSFLQFAQTELPKRKEAAGLLGYGDMLTELEAVLREAPDGPLAQQVRGQFKAALIDEFQDTDPVQLNIFKTLFHGGGKTALFLIGDPKQSIYSFRGADIFSYLAARALADEELTLLTNYRSEPSSIQAVGELFENRGTQTPGPFFCDDIQFEPSTAPDNYGERGATLGGDTAANLNFWLWPGTERSPQELPREGDDWVAAGKARGELPGVVASAIVKLLQSDAHFEQREKEPESVKPGDIAVLVAKNAQAVAMKKALAERGVPAVLKTHESVFAASEAADLELLLEAIAAPNNLSRIKQLLATDLLGFDGHALHRLPELYDLEAAALSECSTDEQRMIKVAKGLPDYRTLMVKEGFLPMYRRFLAEGQVREQALHFDDGDRRLTNLFHLGEILQETMATHRMSATSLARWLARQRQDNRPDDKNQLRLESDENAVRLVTVHRSKGLEYPIVYVPFAWDRKNTPEEGFVFHPDAKEHPGQVVLDLGSKELEKSRVIAAQETLANELRLLYVATTRAKHRCTVVHGRLGSPGHPQGQKEITSLAWLLHSGAGMEVNPADKDAGIAKLTPEIVTQDLETLAKKTGGTIGSELLPQSNGERWKPKTDSDKPLAAQTFTGNTNAREGIHSFSGWTAGDHHFHDRHEKPDHDAGANEPVEPAEPKGIHKFPAGITAGNCLHGIMEHLDFEKAATQDESDQSQLAIINQYLDRFGFSELKDGLTEAFHQNIRDQLNTPLREGDDFTLAKLKAKDRIAELDFTQRLAKVDPNHLRDIFARHQSDAWPDTLPDRIGQLSFNPLRGYMRGSIDLVFRRGERFFILDWKSNRLGHDATAYTPDRLPAAMARSFYHLQYHIYTVALDAYLRQRVESYEYATHFGGAYYLFNRGIDPAQPGQGIFFDLPEPELIAELSTAFGLHE
jgi:exodeoxyribonuclease V beta subunit